VDKLMGVIGLPSSWFAATGDHHTRTLRAAVTRSFLHGNGGGEHHRVATWRQDSRRRPYQPYQLAVVSTRLVAAHPRQVDHTLQLRMVVGRVPDLDEENSPAEVVDNLLVPLG